MKQLLFFILILLIAGCETTNQNNDNQLLSKFSINPSVRNIVQGNQNGILMIPQDCFVDADGNTVKEEVVIKFTEAYSIKDIFELNLETNSEDGLLISGGMVNLEATTESGEVVQIASDKSITYQKAISNQDTNRYQFFSQSESGHWGNPEPNSSYLTYYPINLHSTIYTYLDNTDSGTENKKILFSKKKLPSKKPFYGEENLITTFQSFMEGPGQYFMDHSLEPVKIPDSVLNKSYIFSKEYEDRFNALPPFDEFFTGIHLIYLRHLDKPLWIADSLALEEIKQELAYYENKSANHDTFVKDLYTYAYNALTSFLNQRKSTFPPDFFSEEELNTLTKFYNKISIVNYIQSYSLRKSGWHNIDIFLKEKYKNIFNIDFQIDCNITPEKLFLLFKKDKVSLAASSNENNKYKCSAKMPKVSAYLIALGEQDGQLLFAQK